ncbi:hypothetical protein [Saccharothrix australiensis]|uniref:hypothetical protein n=1 Tax=Saccharothrix australiensis TaxID=2072 RepID=UPI00147756B3|nr:hypothetical protein [Saccharothrix australiensis]
MAADGHVAPARLAHRLRDRLVAGLTGAGVCAVRVVAGPRGVPVPVVVPVVVAVARAVRAAVIGLCGVPAGSRGVPRAVAGVRAALVGVCRGSGVVTASGGASEVVTASCAVRGRRCA